MSKHKFFLILALAAFVFAAMEGLLLGQTTDVTSKRRADQSIQGTVKDADGLPLPGATVSLKGTLIQTETDGQGNFAFSGLSVGVWTVVASLPSFQTSETNATLNPGQALRLEIRLDLAPLDYEVTVRSDVPKLMDASESIGVVSVSPVQISTLPSLGEKDIFRSLQLMPGISASNEASSGLYVRGGTPDQNLVLFDGFTVYSVDHFFGIFSAFNAQAVDNITMHKGGFESKYGGRISSVVELDGRSGNREEVAFGGGASLLSYSGYAEAPLGRNASLLLAGRRSFQSPLSNRIRDSYSQGQAGGGPGAGGPGGRAAFATQPDSTFYDLNARLTYDPGRRDHFVLSLYNGQDNLDSSRNMNLPGGFGNQTRAIGGEITNLTQWGNTGASLSWFRQWRDSFSSSFTLAHSRYFKDRDRRSKMTLTDSDTGEETTTERGSAEGNRLRDSTISLNNALTLGYRHLVEFGAQATRNDIDYLFNMSEADASLDRRQKATQYSLYLQDRWSPFPRFSVTPGLRATYFDRSARTYLEPRLSLMLNATDRLRLKAAGGLYHQYAKNLVREDVLQGDQDFWTLADGSTLPVSSAVHSIVGLSYETPSYLFDAEAYRKDLRGLAEFGAMRLGRGGWGPSPGQPPPGGGPGPIDFTRLFFLGEGKAEGVEFLLQKKFGEHIGWLTYSLGRVRHFFPDLSNSWYPASHDSTHELKLVDSWRYRKFTISGAWVFATGKPVTAPTGIEEITLPNGRVISIPEFGGKNASRLPDYHRLDASVSRDLYAGETNKVTAGLSLFNAYNRQNVWRREYDVVEDELIPTDINYLSWTLSAFLNFDLAVPSPVRRAGPAWKESAPNNTSAVDASAGGQTGKAAERPARIYDFLGKVETMTGNSLTVTSNWGNRSFLLDEATITGQGHYEPGTPVHVYYKKRADEYLVTMVFRTIK